MANAVQKYQAARFQSWLNFLAAGTASGYVGGLLGEFGIPQADPRTTPPAQYVTDVPFWQAAVDYLWTTQLDAWNASHAPSKTLWVTTWASGFWGWYNLAELTNAVSYTATGTNLNAPLAPGMLDVREAHPAQAAGVKYGTNVAGMDFGGGFRGSFDNAHLGTVGANFYPPTAGDAAALAARGVKLVRLPFLWERIQPTLLGPLDPTHLGYLTTFVNACAANGIGVVLDLHNYARYSYSLGGVANRTIKLRVAPGLDTTSDGSPDAEGRFGGEYFRDVWKKLSAAFKGNAGIAGYDLMNEPHDVSGTGNPPPDSVAAYGVIGADTLANKQQAAAAGVSHVLVSAFWDRLQPGGAGTALDATQVGILQGWIADAATAGTKVVLSCELQYPPTWAKTAIPQFKNQSATLWSGTPANGDDVRDWIWTQTGRTHVADFIKKVLAAVDHTKIDAIKLGGGSFGELQYPSDGGAAPYNLWAYGTAPQNGTDLATGMTICPLPGYIPYYGVGATAANDATWANWWLNGLKTWLLWQVDQYKQAGFGGLLYVQHPSFGLRSNWAVGSAPYVQAVAQGQDWDRFLAAYQNDRQVWPYSTWLDMVDPLFPAVNDSDKASWRKLYELAAARGKAALIWGENTGGQTQADMGRVFSTNGAIGMGYRGVMWLNHGLLTAGGANASYADYQTNIGSGGGGGVVTGTTMYDFATTTQNWTGSAAALSWDGGTGHAANGSLKLVYNGAATTNLRADDGGQHLNDPGSGPTLSAWVFLANGSPTNLTGKIQWQDAGFSWHDPGSSSLVDAGGATISTLIPGAWCQIRSSHPTIIAAPHAYAIELDGPAFTTLTCWVDDVARGGGGGGAAQRTIDGALSWEILTQGVLTAIRGNGDTACVIASGESWNIGGFPHSTPWLVEPTTGAGTHRYTTHDYLDPDDAGDYSLFATPPKTWANTLTDARNHGYADDADATPPTLSNVQVTPTATGATITYDTNEVSYHGRCVYRTNSQATWFGSSAWDATQSVAGHRIVVSGLPSSTPHTGQIRTTDLAGNLSTAAISFTTLAGGGGPVTGTRTVSQAALFQAPATSGASRPVPQTALLQASTPPSGTDYATVVLGTAGLRAYWRLDEGAGPTLHDRKSANDLTASAGGITYAVPGSLPNDPNPALRFDGATGQASLTNGSALMAGSAMTIECWVNLPAAPGAAGALAGLRDDFSADFYLLQLPGGTTLECRFRNNANINVDLNPTLSAGAWHYLVFVYDGSSTLSLYVDGTLNTSKPASGTLTATTGTFLLGNDRNNNHTSASLDEVALYNVALSAQQVANHYAARLNSVVAGRWSSVLPGSYGPTLWWKLGETGGTVAADSSGNARPGTIASSGVTYNAAGLVTSPSDGALTFAQNDGYVLVNNASDWLVGTSAALFAWVTFPANPTGFSGILGIRGVGDQGFYFLRESGATSTLVDVHYKASPTGIDLGTQLTITPGVPQWIGAIYRRDRGCVEAYLNGKLVNVFRNAAAANLTLPAGLRFQVGRTDNGADNGTNNQFVWSQGCTIDEVLVWNRAPTNIELDDLYQAGLNQPRTRNTFALLDTTRWFGLALNGNFEEYSANTTLDQANADVGTPVQVAQTFRSWGDSDPIVRTESLASMRGALPLVTWEPWNSTNGVAQPAYSLANITAGNFDNTLIKPFAQAVAAYGGEVLLRFAHEMNGNWYPWCPGVNGNAAGGAGYVAMWKHVYDVFMGQLTAAQQARVRWVWSPNIDNAATPPSPGMTLISSLYPSGTSAVTGRDYVDYLAIDGYNWGTDDLVAHPEGWQTPAQVFVATYQQLAALHPTKLMVLAETSSSETGGDKGAWLTDLATRAMLRQCPRVRGIVVFSLTKERDWRYNSTAVARNAFVAAITPGSPYYAPQIRSPQATGTSPTTARVTWTSDVPGTGVVTYGPALPLHPPVAGSLPKLLFGIGDELTVAQTSTLATNAPIKLLTSWYNKPADLSFMTPWQASTIPNAYAAGYALHLIVFVPDAAVTVNTKYGVGCGRVYPLTPGFLGDMQQLAQIFGAPGSGPPLYVTMFTEVQTYGCGGGAWNPDPQTNIYYRALKDVYMDAMDVFHQYAPNAKVSLGWGGWQTRGDNPATGGGRSMFQYFDDVLRASDFQSFQAMQLDTNVNDIPAMTQLLGQYGPVMLAHYRPDASPPTPASQAVWNNDLTQVLTDSSLASLVANGLFAWSFMDSQYLTDATGNSLATNAVQRYGTTWDATTRAAPIQYAYSQTANDTNNPGILTSHSVTLSGLTTGQVYHARISSTD